MVGCAKRSLCCCQLCQMPATRVRSRNQYYNMCLSQVQQQRTEPEPIPGKPQQFPHRCEPLVAIDPDNGLRFDLMGPTGSALALVKKIGKAAVNKLCWSRR